MQPRLQQGQTRCGLMPASWSPQEWLPWKLGQDGPAQSGWSTFRVLRAWPPGPASWQHLQSRGITERGWGTEATQLGNPEPELLGHLPVSTCSRHCYGCGVGWLPCLGACIYHRCGLKKQKNPTKNKKQKNQPTTPNLGVGFLLLKIVLC